MMTVQTMKTSRQDFLLPNSAIQIQDAVLVVSLSSKLELIYSLPWGNTCNWQWQQPLFLCQECQQVTEVWNSPEGVLGPH